MKWKRTGLAVAMALAMAEGASAQFTYGTTGLLHMPTADMQKDKTFMFGGAYLNEMATPSHWYYDTWNYYINITILPWVEVGYTCVLHTAEHLGVDKYGYSGFTNQDRSFHGRLRVWKEGWWKEWTPQIVVGVNDLTSAGGGDFANLDVQGDKNGYFSRYYVAATKHIDWNGQWGFHAAYVYNKRGKDKLNGMAVGMNYQFDITSDSFFAKALNGLNLMGEYDSKYVNVGARYSLWKDHINVVGEWRDCKYPSVGVYFKVHLK